MERPDNVRHDERDEQPVEPEQHRATRHADTQRQSAARLAQQTREQLEASRAALDRALQAKILKLHKDLGWGRLRIHEALSPEHPELTEYRVRRLLATHKADRGGFVIELTPGILTRQ